jgi:hypothetical protein
MDEVVKKQKMFHHLCKSCYTVFVNEAPSDDWCPKAECRKAKHELMRESHIQRDQVEKFFVPETANGASKHRRGAA